jgi:endoglucanase
MIKMRSEIEAWRKRLDTRGNRIGLALAATCLVASSTVANTPRGDRPLYGINLAGAAFAPDRVPGRLGQDYIYPDKAVADPFVKNGFDTVRLSILWERIQPEPFKPLKDSEMALVDKSIKDLGGFKVILLDVHNYARYRGARLDQTPRGGEMLADLWTRLAQRYGLNPNIAFGIMNEPYDISARDWRTIADQSVAAIRATGATNLLLIPGTQWTGAHSWTDGGDQSNAAAFQDFRDPGNNFLFELHQYMDPDSSGTTDSCVDRTIGSERLIAVTKWLRDRKARALLGEFGSPDNPTCLAALDDMMAYINANTDVWAGWTYWAAGAWWGNYAMSIQPDGDKNKPQTEVLLRHMGR